MIVLRRWTARVCALVIVAGVAPHPLRAASLAPLPSSVASDDSSRIVALADALWARILERQVDLAMRYGRPVTQLPTLSLATAAEDAAFARTLLARLDSVSPPPIGSEAWSLAAVVRWGAQTMVDDLQFFWFQNPISPYANVLVRGGVQGIFTSFRFATADDADRYLDLVGQYPGMIESYIAYLRGQHRRGYVLPTDELDAAIALVQGVRTDPAHSALAVDSARLVALEPAAASRFRAQLALEISDRVTPAIDRLLAYLRGPYAASAPTTVGLSQYAGGTAYYRHLVRTSLTFEMTPEEIHQLGLRNVARVNAEMDSIRKALRFRGSRADFHRFLRTDPRFVPKSADEVRARMLRFASAMQPRLARAFEVIPPNPYDVRRLDPALEPGMTFGFYRAPSAADPMGIYYFNGAALDQKTSVWYEGLTYHELNPGHHFHFSLVQGQMEALHPLRRTFNSTSYTEGWGEYGALLAGELGGYADPYDRYGRRMMDLFMAVRLVLDTGMNLLGWTRERAMAFMRENSLYSEAEIASETLRYCCDIPAQALGYGMGTMKFQQLRAKAQAALGTKFDLRAFHKVILADGPLPFVALEQRVDQYISGAAAGTR
jgi:uncharacterized protein (DUF885 family)